MSGRLEPASVASPVFGLSEAEVIQLADELVLYHERFKDLFFRKEQMHWGLKYLEGLLLPDHGKSIEEVALTVEGGSVRDMQRFIGEGAWDDAAILEKHAALVSESLGDPDGVLIVDGTDFPK